jgi:retron-type reverse transcriptase
VDAAGDWREPNNPYKARRAPSEAVREGQGGANVPVLRAVRQDPSVGRPEEALKQSKQKRGAAGVDGQAFEQIDEYGEERWLEELQRELQGKTYRPQPVRRVLIPKPGGGERPLGIPTIRDRVVQTAAKLILEPIFEADLSEAAYGYRPGRSGVQAVQEVHQELKRGRTQVVDADLSKYFDTIPHAELMKSVARRVADKAVLHLVKMWLKVPVEERDEQGRPKYSGGKRSKQGTPQGGVISPLLANIYINRLLRVFDKSELMKRSGAKMVNYADDFVVVARSETRRVKPVREPDAGNLHVRFDERRGGNGPWARLGERASESEPSQQAPTNPSGTAPPVDSTPPAGIRTGRDGTRRDGAGERPGVRSRR